MLFARHRVRRPAPIITSGVTGAGASAAHRTNAGGYPPRGISIRTAACGCSCV